MNNKLKNKDLADFLATHNAKNNKSKPPPAPTHTRIGDADAGIYGGSYVIPGEDLPEFYKLYHDEIFVKKKKEYLTEKQLETSGPIAVDFDFRYNYDVEERVHTNENIQDMILLFLDELKQYFIFEENMPFDIFIFEKPHVNRVKDKSITKDGIHMLICLQADHVIQLMIRESILTKIGDIWENLPLTNGWDSVLDEGISKGTTNWQLFGSRKPNNEAYELSQHFIIKYDKTDGEFMMTQQKVENFDLKNNFVKLSVQNASHPKFEMKPSILDIYNAKANLKSKPKKYNSKIKMNLLIDENEEEQTSISIQDIVNKETLEKAVQMMLSQLSSSEYEIKETHEYTQALPERFYEPGSHLLNRQVAFALKHTDDRLFLSWVMLRSKATDFEYESIPTLYHDWRKYFNQTNSGVTRRSIMFWVKQYAYDEYIRVKESTIEHYIEEAITSQTDFDVAVVLYQIFKDKYVCISYSNKGLWYVFKQHRWEPDKGLTLRLAISKDTYYIFDKKRESVMTEMSQYENTDERHEFLKKRGAAISAIQQKLKKTNDKNNIMREAMELFYDKEFIKNMDTNRFLLCFNNGVIDFKENQFRDGYPQDYVTKTTGINYMDFNKYKDDKAFMKTREEIYSFMEKLFPIKSLNKYMWEHLASCLIGTNMNQTFNIYHGSGSNGKSMLTDLMSQTLGEYKGTVPITLVTEKRNGIGGTSSEVIQLKGIRYAVMQEPSKDVKLNEGIMKELTGGDPVQGRALYCESETFETQFKLVVCTNNLFEINSNDDGTWRRIRKCDFSSKFVDNKEAHTDDTPFVFLKDKSLKEKFPIFAPVFASMLVQLAFETHGNVEDCDVVMSASNKYRCGQDHISSFIADSVVRTDNPQDTIKKGELGSHFKLWFQQEQGSRKMPKAQELYEFMDKRFGLCKQKVWTGVKLIMPEKTDDLDNILHNS